MIAKTSKIFWTVSIMAAFTLVGSAKPMAQQNQNTSLEDFLAEINSSEANTTSQLQSRSQAEGNPFLPEDSLNPAPKLKSEAGNDMPAIEAPSSNQIMPLPVESAIELGTEMQEEQKQSLREEALDAAITGVLPLKPDEIRKFLKAYDEVEEASETPIYAYPDQVVEFKSVSLDPGTKPITIDTATGHVTTLNFVDVTGEPWPIQDIGWAGDFEILQPADTESSPYGQNVVRVTPQSEFAYGNLSVRFVNLKTPLVMGIRTNRERVQVRLDVQIPDTGPNGLPPLVESSQVSSVAGSTDLTSFLEGVPPNTSEELTVNGVDGRTRAYSYNGQVYVRTPLTLLSPAWTQSVKSSDGTNVYVLGEVPVLLLSDRGEMKRAFLNKKESIL